VNPIYRASATALACLICAAAVPAATRAESPASPPSAPLPAAPPSAPASTAPAGESSLLPADTGVNWDLIAAQVKSTCDSAIKLAKDTIKRIDATPADRTSFKGIHQVENAVAAMNDALVAQSVLSQLALDKKVRDASTACNEQQAAFGVELSADPIVLAMAQRGVSTAANAKDKKLAELYVESGRRAGAGLDAATRARITKLFDQLNDLQIAFGRTLSEDQSSIVISKEEAASLPASFVKTLKPVGAAYRVPVNESTISIFLEHQRVRTARQRFFMAYNTRGGPANVQRLEQALAIRDQLAHLLGFGSWAAYQLDAKMAKTPTRVIAFLDQIDANLLPKAKSEVATLEQLKRAGGDASPFARWDYAFYENELIKTKYAVNEDEVREYFPVDKVIPAVLGIYEKLLSVTFHPITPADAWAPGVLEYSISDNATGKPIGWFFLDLYPRPGKYQHFANFGLRNGRVLPDGAYLKPISSIIGNWPVGAPGKPALLSHDDVITFFHEFGHLMHSTLSTAPYETYYGTSVRTDFVEAPSQMLENWMWQPAILKEVSSNVNTGKPLPDALIKKLIALKHVADGYDYTTQAFYANYDMTIHSSGPKVAATAVWFDLQKNMTALAAVPGTYPEAGFGHIMGGYDAGYYGYLWSKVFAQDMFTVFQKGGLENPVVGARYRKDILEPGGSIEPDQLLAAFLGRPVSYEAFYRDIGITP